MAGYWLKYGNAALNRNGFAVGEKSYDPYNPLGLPPFTVRAQFYYIPTVGDTRTLVDEANGIWDITYNNTDWSHFFKPDKGSLRAILGANIKGVTDITYLCGECDRLRSVSIFDTSSITSFEGIFESCTSLLDVADLPTQSVTNMHAAFWTCRWLATAPLFDTSSVTNMSSMFKNCSGLIEVPLIDTSSATNMDEMFSGCNNVRTGALALYQQASTQTTPPVSHNYCFSGCGSQTVTGAQELAQIPTSWGGTMQ